jgi:hypothetical protein
MLMNAWGVWVVEETPDCGGDPLDLEPLHVEALEDAVDQAGLLDQIGVKVQLSVNVLVPV